LLTVAIVSLVCASAALATTMAAQAPSKVGISRMDGISQNLFGIGQTLSQ
jgi:hypothetical protein